MDINYKNTQGGTLNLCALEGIYLTDIQGLSAISVINTAETSGYDGATYINSQMPMRNILIVVRIDSEADKISLYNIFRVKQYGTFFYKSEFRDVKIECITEKVVDTPTDFPLQAQISLLCPQPYFESLEILQKSIAAVVPLFKFPFTFPKEGFKFSEKSKSVMVSVTNESDVDVGMEIIFYANSEVINPSLLDVYTNEMVRLDKDPVYVDRPFIMQAGDTVTINTHTGKKRITLLRNGVVTNIFNSKALGFKFMQLHQGNNLYRYNAESNLAGLEVTIYYSAYYAGV